MASMVWREACPTPPSTLLPIQCLSVTPHIGTSGLGPFCVKGNYRAPPRAQWGRSIHVSPHKTPYITPSMDFPSGTGVVWGRRGQQLEFALPVPRPSTRERTCAPLYYIKYYYFISHNFVVWYIFTFYYFISHNSISFTNISNSSRYLYGITYLVTETTS